jgi:hypothetical protein
MFGTTSERLPAHISTQQSGQHPSAYGLEYLSSDGPPGGKGGGKNNGYLFNGGGGGGGSGGGSEGITLHKRGGGNAPSSKSSNSSSSGISIKRSPLNANRGNQSGYQSSKSSKSNRSNGHGHGHDHDHNSRGRDNRRRSRDRDDDSTVAPSDSISSHNSSVLRYKYKSYPPEVMAKKKKEILYRLYRLNKTVMLSKDFTMSDDYFDMKMEYDRIVRDRDMDIGVKWYKDNLITVTAGIENFTTQVYNPLNVKLSGWSTSIRDNSIQYDPVLEDIHEKYKGKSTTPPELRLLWLLITSAVTHHLMASSFAKSNNPELEDIIKSDPELFNHVKQVTLKRNAENQKQNNNPLAGGMLGMMGSMMGMMGGGGGGADNPLSQMMGSMMGQGQGQGLGTAPPQPSHQPQVIHQQQQAQSVHQPAQVQPVQNSKVKGPPNIANILNEIKTIEQNAGHVSQPVANDGLSSFGGSDVSGISISDHRVDQQLPSRLSGKTMMKM